MELGFNIHKDSFLLCGSIKSPGRAGEGMASCLPSLQWRWWSCWWWRQWLWPWWRIEKKRCICFLPCVDVPPPDRPTCWDTGKKLLLEIFVLFLIFILSFTWMLKSSAFFLWPSFTAQWNFFKMSFTEYNWKVKVKVSNVKSERGRIFFLVKMPSLQSPWIFFLNIQNNDFEKKEGLITEITTWIKSRCFWRNLVTFQSFVVTMFFLLW